MSTIKETAQKLMQKTASDGGLHTKDIEDAIMEEIVKDRARIREGVMGSEVGYPANAKHPYIARGSVLGLLTDNILKVED